MSAFPSVAEVFELAGAIVASLGGSTVLVIGLSGWLGKVWAGRIMERERTALTLSIENVKAELVRSIEHDKAELARLQDAHRAELEELSGQRQDALNRKRDVYAQLVTKMRVLLRSSAGKDDDQRSFLEAYDKSYLWALEPVNIAIRDLIVVLEKIAVVRAQLENPLANPIALAPERKTAIQAEFQKLDTEAQTLYRRCMLEMRKDCGFPQSAAEYRLVGF